MLLFVCLLLVSCFLHHTSTFCFIASCGNPSFFFRTLVYAACGSRSSSPLYCTLCLRVVYFGGAFRDTFLLYIHPSHAHDTTRHAMTDAILLVHDYDDQMRFA